VCAQTGTPATPQTSQPRNPTASGIVKLSSMRSGSDSHAAAKNAMTEAHLDARGERGRVAQVRTA